MTRLFPRFGLVTAGLVVALVARALPAHAQSRPELTARIDASTVGVGDEIHLTLHASSEGGNPSDASPGQTPGFTVVAVNSGPSTSITIVNGRMTQKHGLNVTWTLRAAKMGDFAVGPASVAIDGTRYGASPLRIKIVAAGHGPHHAPVQPTDPFGSQFSPFDPFKGFFDPFGDPGAPQAVEVPTDPRLGLDTARGAIAFLHATIDKTQAAIGEQVTLAVYLYFDLAEREPDLTDVHEATAGDFLRRSLFEDDAANRPVGNALVNGRPWVVKLVRKSALFPLKTGDLEIGPMSLSLVRPRINGDPHRESETLHVRVVEPPAAGRPPGYRMGDVGNFALSADVTPRDVEREGALGVTVELSGTGNLPETIMPPARTGIEWLSPETHEKLGATAGDRFGGKRTFSFVVRMHKEGDVDLGDLSIPFWNPDSRSYGVARATLGRVRVRPGAAPIASNTPFDPFEKMPALRTSRAGERAYSSHLADMGSFWLGLGGAPLAYVVVAGAWAASQGIRRKRAERKASPETDLKERVAEAERASSSRDPAAGFAAIVRALESATIARAGVNVRDAQRGETARRLIDHGVDAGAAERFEALYRACETARFAPEATDAGVAARWTEAKEIISSLRGLG